MDSVEDLTVVVACVEAARSIDKCLTALARACTGLRARIVVVDASTDGTAERVRAGWPGIEVVPYPAGTLVPELWAAGYRTARGSVVAFTIGHMVVGPEWAKALMDGLSEASGVGGPIVIDADAGVVDWAIYYLRYSGFTPSQLPDGPINGEIAGDNAAYSKQALDRHATSLMNGFWEVDFHHRLRADGRRLAATSRATAAFSRSTPLWCMARHRLAHGRHFGASRAALGASRLRIIAAAPLVPAVLAWRAFNRTRASSDDRRRFVRALPIVVVLASAWACGEAWGAIAGRYPSRVPLSV